MSKPAWTPGPWSIIPAKGYPYAIQASHVSPHAPGAIRDITRWAAISKPSSAEGQANARLIAEAPAMAEALANALEALGGVLAWHMTPEEYHKHGFRAEDAKSAWDEARAAIKSTRAILARINGDAQ